jgi:hypothetical protein
MNRRADKQHLYPGKAGCPPHKRKIRKGVEDEATHIDEIVESLEADRSSSEIRAALFEPTLAGKVTQMPGKKFVKSSGCWLLGSRREEGHGRLQRSTRVGKSIGERIYKGRHFPKKTKDMG